MRATCLTLTVCGLVAWCQPACAQGASADELSLARAVVSRYCDAWSVVDPAERELVVAEVWAERGEYLDSQPVQARGRDALAAEIARFQQQFPGASFRCNAVQSHHGFVGYTWSMVMADGSEGLSGMDFGEIDSSGRLVRIVSFFEMPPPAG